MTNFASKILGLTILLCLFAITSDTTKAQSNPSAQDEYLNAITPSANSDSYEIEKYQYYIASLNYNKILKEAVSGNVMAQYELGNIYRYGQGVTKSEVIALMWYIISDRNGVPFADKEREFIEINMANDRITLAQKMANIWIKKHHSVIN